MWIEQNFRNMEIYLYRRKHTFSRIWSQIQRTVLNLNFKCFHDINLPGISSSQVIYLLCVFYKNLRSGRTGQRYLVHFPRGHAHGVLVRRVAAPQRLDERRGGLAAPDHVLLALLLLNLQCEAGAENTLLNRQHITTSQSIRSEAKDLAF